MEIKFDKYINMIRKQAHYICKKYNYDDYNDIESQGILIYFESLEKYDVTKSNFSTYLYTELQRLNDYVKYQYHKCGYRSSEIEDKYTQTVKTNFFEFMNSAKSVLSENAYKLLDFIVEFEWMFPKYKNKPTECQMMEYLGCSRIKVKEYFQECKNFYLSEGQFC